MADSNITKRALGKSLKTLMSELPFSKISVGEICDRCSMNRKSFYYHFRDKYELVNWIFDREFVFADKAKDNSSVWDGFQRMCDYLYNNKEFYRQSFLIEGQNSFSEHFTEYCKSNFATHLQSERYSENDDFQSAMLAEMVTSAVKLWLLNKESMSAEQFAEAFRTTFEKVSVRIYRDMNRLAQ